MSQKPNTSNEYSEVDMSRHKEIILKSISAIILLLIKELRKNHILQSEYILQLIADANGLLLILKFLNQDIVQYLKLQNSKNEIEEIM